MITMSMFDRIQKTIQIQKFSETSLLIDLSKDVKHDLNIKKTGEYGKVGDLPFQIWRCKIGWGRSNRWWYGKTIEEAFLKAKGVTQQEILNSTRKTQ